MANPSHLFTVRIWLEELGNDLSEWRGQVQLVANGDTRYFRDWSALVAHLNEMLATFAGEREDSNSASIENSQD